MRRILNAEWAGLLAAIVAGAIVLTAVSPNFLSEFNFYVLLRSVCVSIIVAFAQMVTLAVGQMNLSVGALGGMTAILFGGMMRGLWRAAVARGPGRDRDRRSRRTRQRSPGRPHWHQRLHCHAGDSLRLHRRQPRPHQIGPVLQNAEPLCRTSATAGSGRFRFCSSLRSSSPRCWRCFCSACRSAGGFWLSAATARRRRFRGFRLAMRSSSRIAFPGCSPRSGRFLPSPSSARRSR